MILLKREMSMPWIKPVLREIFALFVEDGSFALTILLWIAAAWVVLPRLRLPAGWGGAILFAGLATILLESTIRRARR
jgi:hypothetical protein